MSKKIGSQLVQAILAMQKDPSKRTAELSVHVWLHDKDEKTGQPIGSHFHCDLSSPLVQNQKIFDHANLEASVAASKLEQPLVHGRYTVMVDANADVFVTSAPEGATNAMMDFLVRRTGAVLFQLSNSLEDAFSEWPSELATRHALLAGYSNVMRRKLERGTDTNPIQVIVIGHKEEKRSLLQDILPSFLAPIFGENEFMNGNNVVLTAFDDKNPCSPAVRQAYAAHATQILNDEIEPEIAPKIVERVQLAIDTLTTRLAKRQATKLNDATAEADDNAPLVTTNVPTATAGGEASLADNSDNSNGQSTSAPA